jgi:hypothetical protein
LKTIVGQFFIIAIIFLWAFQLYAEVNCRGNFYTRLASGEVSESRIEFISQYYNSNPYIPPMEVNSPFIFKDDRKYDDWDYVRIYREKDFIYSTGFRDSQFNYKDINWDRETFLKFKDQAMVGFSLICKMR